MARAKETPPAQKDYCVWADCNRRVYQYVSAASPEEAYRIAKESPESWEFCFEHEDNGYRVSDDVQDSETQAFITIGERIHCVTCRSEIVETVNDSNFGDGECGTCEYQRYLMSPDLGTALDDLLELSVDQNQAAGNDLAEREQEVYERATALLKRANERASS